MTHLQKVAEKRLSAMLPMLVAFATFLFFVATRAVQHDRNTIYRLLEIESDSLKAMTEARHVLFSPVAAGFYRLWRSLGYSGSSLLPSQILVAAFGAMGSGIVTALLGRFCRDVTLTVLLAIGFVGSYSYWYHSTDVEYWTPYIVAVLALTVFFLRWFYEKHHATSIIWIILLTYVSILFWSAGIILGIIVAVSFLMLPSRHTWRDRWGSFLAFGSAEALLLTVTYSWLGMRVHGIPSYRQLISWLGTYPGRMPIWGRADPHRIFDSAWSLAASVLPFWNGLGLRGLLRGQLDPTKIIPQAALLATVGLVAVVTVHWLHNRTPLVSQDISPFLLLWVVTYSLFITWFDPFEPKWWVIALIPLWLLFGDLSLSWVQCSGRTGYLAVSVWVALLLLSNWFNAMGPRHFDVGDDYRKAMYCIEQMAPQDVLVTPYAQEWPLYVQYFGRRQLLDVGGQALYHSPDYARQRLLELVCSTNHGTVYLADHTQLTAAEWQFITDNMGITPLTFEGFHTEEAWRWGGEPVWRIVGSTECDGLP